MKGRVCIISVDGICIVVTNLSLILSSLSIKIASNYIGSYQQIKLVT